MKLRTRYVVVFATFALPVLSYAALTDLTGQLRAPQMSLGAIEAVGGVISVLPPTPPGLPAISLQRVIL